MVHISFSRHQLMLAWKHILLFGYLASSSHAETVVYKADITEIPGTASGVTGSVVVFVPENTHDDDSAYAIAYGGFLSNLTPSCVGCGVHVHDGKSCADTDSQGGHYFVSPVTEDPWNGDTTYDSDIDGDTTFYHLVKMGKISASEMDGRTVVVHNAIGERIACGLLVKESASDVLSNKLDELETSGVSGTVTAYQIGSTEKVCLHGKASGLTANAESILGGTHIHAGTSCLSAETQKGHYFNSGITDPWIPVGYSSTDANGDAEFAACVKTGETGYPGKAFVVHDSNKKRVSCGLLELEDDDVGFIQCFLQFFGFDS